MIKYVKLNTIDVVKGEKTKLWHFLVTVSAMGEEVKLRLDEKGFYRNEYSTADAIAYNTEFAELKKTLFPDVVAEDGTDRQLTAEESLRYKDEQIKLQEKHCFRCDYVVEGINSKELFDKLSLHTDNTWEEHSSIMDELVD